MSNTYLVYLEWPERCFRADAAAIGCLRTLVPKGSRIVRVRSEAAFLKALPRATHALVWEFRSDWFALAPKLRVLATPAAGRELVPVSGPDGVRIHFGGFQGGIISETILAFMLAWTHGFFHRNLFPLWPRTAMAECCGEMSGTKAVILGYGRIGRAVGERLRPFGVDVFGYSRHLHVTRAQLDSRLRSADWLIVALPSDTGTDGIVGPSLLRKLPRRCVVVNVGRGNAVDETALLSALRSGRIAGAYLDVYRNEPTVLKPKIAVGGVDLANADDAELPPTLIRMPHASAYSPSYLNMFFRELKDEGLV